MSSTLETLSVIICTVQFIMGIVGNGFIVLINGMDWVRIRKISLIDFILICLASSRICLLWTTIFVMFLKLVHMNLLSSKSIMMSAVISWTGSTCFSTAFTTCLTLFYFFKIANFSNLIFRWMKQRLHVVLLTIVLGTVLSFCLSTIFVDECANIWAQNWAKMTQNFTFGYRESFDDWLPYFILLNIVLIFFFAVSLISFLLLIFSLWRHTKRMKLQGMYSRDSSTEAHVRALKAMISFLFLFIMLYISHAMLFLSCCVLESVVANIFSQTLILLYPSVHPFLLILWNNKLKQASLRVLS